MDQFNNNNYAWDQGAPVGDRGGLFPSSSSHTWDYQLQLANSWDQQQLQHFSAVHHHQEPSSSRDQHLNSWSQQQQTTTTSTGRNSDWPSRHSWAARSAQLSPSHYPVAVQQHQQPVTKRHSAPGSLWSASTAKPTTLAARDQGPAAGDFAVRGDVTATIDDHRRWGHPRSSGVQGSSTVCGGDRGNNGAQTTALANSGDGASTFDWDAEVDNVFRAEIKECFGDWYQ